MKVFLSPLAEKKVMLLLEYIELEWSKGSKKVFLSKLKGKFDQISKHPYSCIKSNVFPSLFKCTVTKQTSFYYRIMSDEIEIITLIDNRQDPKKTHEEITKFFT
jgi:plasmid stabilization system protein ParE